MLGLSLSLDYRLEVPLNLVFRQRVSYVKCVKTDFSVQASVQQGGEESFSTGRWRLKITFYTV